MNQEIERRRTFAVNCRSGKRSKTAADLLAKKGYKGVELDSGFKGWITDGNNIVK